MRTFTLYANDGGGRRRVVQYLDLPRPKVAELFEHDDAHAAEPRQRSSGVIAERRKAPRPRNPESDRNH